MQTVAGSPSRAMILAAFAVVYVVWGSTYLAIRYAVETLPPFLMAGARFVLAGGILTFWAVWRDGERATASNWRAATIAGALLLLGGNGAVVWAEQRVPSGLAALLVATMPFWMVLADWLRPGGQAPRAGVALGIAIGLAGMVILVGPGSLGDDAVDPVGAAVLTFGAASWAVGSLYARRAPLPRNAVFGTGLEMLAGGALLSILGAATGEIGRLDLGRASTASLAGFFYLVVFGSLIGFTAFAWLLRVASPAAVSTYAFVNPIVAVLLGWAIAHEQVSSRTIVAAAVIVGSVALITWSTTRKAAPPPAPGPLPHPAPECGD